MLKDYVKGGNVVSPYQWLWRNAFAFGDVLVMVFMSCSERDE